MVIAPSDPPRYIGAMWTILAHVIVLISLAAIAGLHRVLW